MGESSQEQREAQQGAQALVSSCRRFEPSPAHARACSVCKLDADQLADLELSYIGWTPVDQLAQLYEVKAMTITRHAHACRLDLFKAANTAGGYGQLVAAGLNNAAEKATPDHALKALDRLEEMRADRSGPAAPAGPGAEPPTSWEAEIRIAARGTGQPPKLDQLAPQIPTIEPDHADPPAQIVQAPRVDRADQLDREANSPPDQPIQAGEPGQLLARPADGDPFA